MKLKVENNAGLLIESMNNEQRNGFMSHLYQTNTVLPKKHVAEWERSLLIKEPGDKTFYISKKVVNNCKLIKITQVLVEWFNKLPSQSGTFIIEESGGIWFKYKIVENGDISLAVFYETLTEDGKDTYENLNFYNIPGPNSTIGQIITPPEGLFIFFVQLLLFKFYAKIKEVTVKPNTKVKIDSTKILSPSIKNETNLNLIYVDSLWDKTIIVAGEFKVSGHWRMQPYGNRDNQYYQLIWIDEFKKHGYIRQAGKVRHGDTDDSGGI